MRNLRRVTAFADELATLKGPCPERECECGDAAHIHALAEWQRIRWFCSDCWDALPRDKRVTWAPLTRLYE